MPNSKPRNYTAKRMIKEGTGYTKVIQNKKKNNSKKLSTHEYLEEYENECLEDDIYFSSNEDLDYV